ncbi:c-type cytochrome [Winogradskyella ursingii]|uniref:c-type cytochrome n=1 Tax=Winogradskyella ursingii TaxID=2686079 RepID=UPI0015CB8EE9|nr:cytochrome c [Winogradskyella ursingii]
MIKYLKFALALSLIVSCNSNDKKSNNAAKQSYPVAAKTNSENEIKKIEEETPKTQDQKTLKAQSIERGKMVYDDMCITCHMANGEGVPKAFPPVADSDYLREKQTKSIIGIKKGMTGEMVVNGVTYNSVMSPLGLSDKEVADVMNYINNAWGNEIDNFVTLEKVSKALASD